MSKVIDLDENFNVSLYLDVYRLISFRLGMKMGNTKLYIFISVWMTLTFIQCHSCMRNKKLRCPFSQNFLMDLDL